MNVINDRVKLRRSLNFLGGFSYFNPDNLVECSLCLPSGSNLTEEEKERIKSALISILEK